MRRLRVSILVALLMGTLTLGSVRSAHAVYCGDVPGVGDPCLAVCRVAATAHVRCIFGP